MIGTILFCVLAYIAFTGILLVGPLTYLEQAKTNKEKQMYARWSAVIVVWPISIFFVIPWAIYKGVSKLWSLMFIDSGKPKLFEGLHK